MDESPLEALRLWGATPAQVDEWRQALHADAQAQEADVWPELWHPLQVFLAMETQWRTAPRGMGGLAWIGLDYSALDMALRIARPHVPRAMRQDRRRSRPQLHELLRAIEAAAVEQRNKG